MPAVEEEEEHIAAEAESLKEEITQEGVEQKQHLRRRTRIKKPSAKLRGTYVAGSNEIGEIHGYTLPSQQQTILKQLYEKYENL